MRWPRGARAALAATCLYSLFIGATAVFAPRTFYDDFPFVAHWVERLPPYNEHLVTDIGGLYLGLAVLFAWAAWKPERTLVLAASSSFLLTTALHLAFHAGNLRGFGGVDGAAELAALGSLLVPPLLAIRWSATPRALSASSTRGARK